MTENAMQYIIYGNDPHALTNSKADAAPLIARLNAAFGYPHGSTTTVTDTEEKVGGAATGVPISQVAQWSWVDLAYKNISDYLTVAEINALQPFQYLVGQQWWGEE